MYQDIAIISLLWAVYFFLHSYLAVSNVKSWFRKKLPNTYQYYRLAYSTISVLTLMPILYFLASTPSEPVFERTSVIKYFGLMFTAWGVFILKASFRSYSIREFMGLTVNESKPEFIREGLLSYMRHPIYTGTIMISIGFWLFIPNVLNLATILCIFIYLAIGIRLEEKKLIEEFGEDYKRFKKEVPMLIPKITSFLSKKLR